MLIKFYSDAGGFSMFGDAAVKLLRMAGHSGTVPSAILPEDIPAAIEKLEAALAGGAGAASDVNPVDDEDGGEIAVSLRQRAFPLLELFNNAVKANCSVLWNKA